MNGGRGGTGGHWLRRAAARLLQAAALVLAVAMTLALPTKAADERAVKPRVAPVYRKIAKHVKITGAVMVEATVDADGKVSDVKTLRGNHALAPAAEDAVRKWRFAPGAERSTVDVEVNFALSH